MDHTRSPRRAAAVLFLPSMRMGAWAFLLSAVAVGAVQGQERDPIPLSQHQVLTQSIGWVEVEVEYRRPVARGRELFGALVPYDEPWTPAADSAAVVRFSDDVWLDGEAVPAGSYSLWLIPRAAPRAWTVILSSAARVFHAPYPEGRDVVRFEAMPGEATHVETLQLGFPVVEGPEALLQLQWGTVTLPMTIRVSPG